MKKTSFILVAFLLLSTFVFAQSPDISPERKAAVDSLALEKVRDLSKYVAIIGSKSTSKSEADRVIARVEELFGDNSEIGVSSTSRKEIRYLKARKKDCPVKDRRCKSYWEHLMLLNYDKVNIEWFNIQYVSDLQKQPDGKYVGVITIFQKFEGITKEGSKYVDVTKKDITIYVERKQTQIGGRLIGFWDVLLGDIRVKDTQKG